MEGFHMTCMEAQALITPFVNDRLDIATLERFIDHVESCKECREELEVYYAILTAMRQLDEDEDVLADFEKELTHKLKESQELILHTRLVHIRKRILFFVIVICLGLFTSVSVNVVEDAIDLSKEKQYELFLMEQKVLKPYMNHELLEELIPYQELLKDIERIEAEKEEMEALMLEEQKKLMTKQRKKDIQAALITANEALKEQYGLSNRYLREYEEALDLMRVRWKETGSRQKEDNPFSNAPLEYSR